MLSFIVYILLGIKLLIIILVIQKGLLTMGNKMNFDMLFSRRACFRNRLVPRCVYSLYLSICTLVNSVVKNAAHCFLLSNLQMLLLLKRWSFASLAALKVIILTTCLVTSDDNFVNLTTLPLQCLFVSSLISDFFLLHLILPTMKWLKDHIPLERYFIVVCLLINGLMTAYGDIDLDQLWFR